MKTYLPLLALFFAAISHGMEIDSDEEDTLSIRPGIMAPSQALDMIADNVVNTSPKIRKIRFGDFSALTTTSLNFSQLKYSYKNEPVAFTLDMITVKSTGDDAAESLANNQLLEEITVESTIDPTKQHACD